MFVGLSAVARVGPSRSILVAGIYPDRPWETALGTGAQELERMRKDLLRVQEELQKSRGELESQRVSTEPSQGRILGKRKPGRDLSNLLSLGLWGLLGCVASYRISVDKAMPALQLVDKAAVDVSTSS